MNKDLPDVQAGFRKGRGTRNQIANICWIIEKAREFQKNICFIDYTKPVDCVDDYKRWTILKDMGILDHLTCLLRNLYAGQEGTIRTRHGTMELFQIGKGLCQCYILSPCLLICRVHHVKCQAGWINHKLDSWLPGGISTTSDMQMTPPLWQKVRRN